MKRREPAVPLSLLLLFTGAHLDATARIRARDAGRLPRDRGWLFASAVAGTNHPQLVSARAGLILRVEGEVLRRHGGATDVQPLNKGATLDDGDVVLTTETGRADWSLTPDSYLHVAGSGQVRAYMTELDRMHFDVERGEVVLVVRSLKGGASLVIHAPPGPVTVRKAGRYLFRVAENGETVAAVGKKGELAYTDENGRDEILGKRMSVIFHRAGKKIAPES